MARPALLARGTGTRRSSRWPAASRPSRGAGEQSRRIGLGRRLRGRAGGDPPLPCGFTLDRAEAELAALAARPEWRTLAAVRDGRVALVDGSAYFSRPGPRLKESLAIAAAAIHPDACRDLAPADGFRLLGA